ncbi:hypothetical protein [Paracoccus siganidrum]|uniref:hypothetical protein n=1 Tax=Paracoccus siganidrum TaxID=1276757 RepID=UPI000E73A4CB|nr:hypothetical protein [Paracoccus siganidrum]RMC39005.1 hypothetical protein C9E82_06645 [Paracoccus siganidrum]
MSDPLESRDTAAPKMAALMVYAEPDLVAQIEAERASIAGRAGLPSVSVSATIASVLRRALADQKAAT